MGAVPLNSGYKNQSANVTQGFPFENQLREVVNNVAQT